MKKKTKENKKQDSKKKSNCKYRFNLIVVRMFLYGSKTNVKIVVIKYECVFYWTSEILNHWMIGPNFPILTLAIKANANIV